MSEQRLANLPNGARFHVLHPERPELARLHLVKRYQGESGVLVEVVGGRHDGRVMRLGARTPVREVET